MKQPRRLMNHTDVKKASTYAIAVNGLEMGLIAIVLAAELIQPSGETNHPLLRLLVITAAVAVLLGALIDIRDALVIRRIASQVDDLEQAVTNVEQLNITLRAQRHDFLNHLQVVYSLMEMQEWEEASAYIEDVYGKITAVSSVLRTASPAVNALLQVKIGACEKAGIRTDVQIQSAWKDLPMPAWEMCKVLSNLLDNAIDALRDTPEPALRITLTEDLHSYHFTVADNGPGIPEELRETIFDAGTTTKESGHGMGLYITRETLRNYGGDIRVRCEGDGTAFEGWVPRSAPRETEN